MSVEYVLSPFEVLDHGPIPYHKLPMAGDPDLDRQLKSFQALAIAELTFRLVRAPISVFREVVPAAEYLSLREGGEVALVKYLTDRFNGGAEPPAVVFLWEKTSDLHEPRLIDGYHRASAAAAAGRESIKAYEALNWYWRGLPRTR